VEPLRVVHGLTKITTGRGAIPARFFLSAFWTISRWSLDGTTDKRVDWLKPFADAASVQQSIGRAAGQAATWIGNNVNFLRDWIGADTRRAQSGNGAWDGTTGTPTYFQLRFAGLPQASYEMTAFFMMWNT
jgi:hypothetical protein